MKKLLYLVLFICIIALSGCDVFTPRESEKPDKPAEWNSFPITPEKTLENLLFSYNYRENVYNYQNLFADGFSFFFDNQDVSDFSLPVSWNKSSETEMLINAFQRINANSAMALTLSKITSQNDNIQVDRAWFYRNYELTIPHNINGLPHVFAGQFRIYMIKDNNGFWVIKEWNDYRLSSSWTWGRIKNEFAL
ncbi:MAG TPA: hypothetical protein PKZ69_03445 [Candidatus Cloacimonadota bacterium]|nr:hypothetical protein [Candidatus Cloacimonadota bacterium]HOQ79866.1 hypothetical protein [Candidatus Cloacimonadota bacterium]HPK40654.1 hypothetical protein [Candidatus Cloacimonadota bacterium]